jgi:hypothetical protein
MNPFEMVVAIVAIGAIASVLRAKYGVVRGHKGETLVQRTPDPEAQRLRDEVKALKDRIAVLEREIIFAGSKRATNRESSVLVYAPSGAVFAGVSGATRAKRRIS